MPWHSKTSAGREPVTFQIRTINKGFEFFAGLFFKASSPLFHRRGIPTMAPLRFFSTKCFESSCVLRISQGPRSNIWTLKIQSTFVCIIFPFLCILKKGKTNILKKFSSPYGILINFFVPFVRSNNICNDQASPPFCQF